MKSFFSTLLSAGLLLCALGAAVHAQGPPADILIPDSSIEHPWDVGVRAHTNHLIHLRPQAGSGGPTGKSPAQIRMAYGLPATGGSGVIVIVDAYHYASSLNDFNYFSKQFGLPAEPSANATASTNKVFQVVYATGAQPRTDGGWAQEEALDIEWAHAMAPNAKIILVEAASSSLSDLYVGVDAATKLNPQEISMSWGGSEFSGETGYDSHFPQNNGIVYFASSGDTGGVTIYPGTSPNVVSAGGTSLFLNSDGTYKSESGWSGSGGGKSQYEPTPGYQSGISSFLSGTRGVPDLSFDADPNTGVSVYDSTRYQGVSGWMVFGGTSVSSPSLAGIVNLAGPNTDTVSELTMIYKNLGTGNFRDVIGGTAGGNTAVAGWDFVTGVGSCLGLLGL